MNDELSKDEKLILDAFAAMGCPSSKHEVFGHTQPVKDRTTDDIIGSLKSKGMLEAVPTAITADRFGGTRFNVLEKGLEKLGRAAPQKSKAGKPTVLNGKHKQRKAG